MATTRKDRARIDAHAAGGRARGRLSFSLSPSDGSLARALSSASSGQINSGIKIWLANILDPRLCVCAGTHVYVGNRCHDDDDDSSRLRRVSAFGRTNWTKTRRFFVTLDVLRGIDIALSLICTFQLTQHPLTQIDAMHDDAAECNAAVSLLRSFEVPARSHGAYIHRQILMKIFIFMYSLFIGEWRRRRWMVGGSTSTSAAGGGGGVAGTKKKRERKKGSRERAPPQRRILSIPLKLFSPLANHPFGAPHESSPPPRCRLEYRNRSVGAKGHGGKRGLVRNTGGGGEGCAGYGGVTVAGLVVEVRRASSIKIIFQRALPPARYHPEISAL
ncbi:hypothetical protein ALC56_08654 [Trachymyrmex septentrionalis]|uniref:Uncharacterized protein n=1 Tax=Trachymyrmex septentrionalis TaxID=34720 RepID=A0A195F8U8_9HYME|nr:hypothetical protein ALC56_08654 [Trachymyrmex septentrionalis]